MDYRGGAAAQDAAEEDVLLGELGRGRGGGRVCAEVEVRG